MGKEQPEACEDGLLAADKEAEHAIASAAATAGVNSVAAGGAPPWLPLAQVMGQSLSSGLRRGTGMGMGGAKIGGTDTRMQG